MVRPTGSRSHRHIPHMPIDAEVILRIPNSKVRTLDAQGYPIDHTAFRFRRKIQIENLPAPGIVIYLDTVSGIQVAAEVVRTDWDDAQGMFMISCRHAGRSMPPE